MAIVSNQIRCKKCGDTPYSTHRHDLKNCKCGAIFVDGGMAYLKRGGDLSAYEDMSIIIDEDKLDKIIQEAKAAKDIGRNTLGIVYAVLRAMRDTGLLVK